MDEIKVWILMGIVTATGSILVKIVSGEAKKAIARLDEMVKSLNQIALTINTHEQRIIALQEAHNNGSHRMNDHATRLRTLEQEVAVLKSND